MKVYIDNREQKKIQNLINYWKDNKDRYQKIESIEVRQNATSDICTADGLVGIERKSSADFIGSICGGKLKQQLYELKQNFSYPYMFIEDFDGIMDCIEKSPQVHPNVIVGTIASVFAHSQVPVCFVGGFYNQIVLTTLNKFYDGKEKQYDKDYTPIRRTATKDEYQKNIIMGLPNVGLTDSEKLLKANNNSVYNFVRTAVENPEKLKNIKGIGDKKIQKMKEILQ